MKANLRSLAQTDSGSPSSEDTPEARREYAQKKLIGLQSEVEFCDYIRAALFAYTPVHNQSKQCTAAAHFVGVDVETVRRWLNGTTPNTKHFWPLGMFAFLHTLPIETQDQVIQSIFGMVGDQ